MVAFLVVQLRIAQLSVVAALVYSGTAFTWIWDNGQKPIISST